MLLFSSDNIYSKLSFSKNYSRNTEPTVWIQLTTDVLLVLIWVQTVCEGYQPTTNIVASKERVKLPIYILYHQIQNIYKLGKDKLQVLELGSHYEKKTIKVHVFQYERASQKLLRII